MKLNTKLVFCTLFLASPVFAEPILSSNSRIYYATPEQAQEQNNQPDLTEDKLAGISLEQMLSSLEKPKPTTNKPTKNSENQIINAENQVSNPQILEDTQYETAIETSDNSRKNTPENPMVQPSSETVAIPKKTIVPVQKNNTQLPINTPVQTEVQPLPEQTSKVAETPSKPKQESNTKTQNDTEAENIEFQKYTRTKYLPPVTTQMATTKQEPTEITDNSAVMETVTPNTANEGENLHKNQSDTMKQQPDLPLPVSTYPPEEIFNQQSFEKP